MPSLLLIAALAATPLPDDDRPDPDHHRSVYALSPRLDVPVIALATLGSALPYLFADGIIEPRCPCDPATLHRFDRPAIRFENGALAALSTVALAAAILGPLVLDAKLVGFTPTLLEDVTVLVEALAVSGAFATLAKFSVQRPIPMVYAGHPEFIGDARGYRGFYSGHTALAATALSTLAMTLSARYGFRVWPWVLAGLVSGGVGVARIVSGYHFPSDVVVGLLAGTAVGILVPALHLRGNETEAPTVSIAVSGAGLTVRFP